MEPTTDALECNIDDKDLVRAAAGALARPSNFGYYGELDLFRTWGLTMSQGRGSDAVERSNFTCVTAALREAIKSVGSDPDDYIDIVHCGHSLFGWVDHVAVRVLTDGDGEVQPGNITPAFRWLASTMLYLADDYPVFDDTHFYALEYEEAVEIVLDNLDTIRSDAANSVDDAVAGARLVPGWITAEDVLTCLHRNGEDTPRENHDQYEETATAVWELVDAGAPAVITVA